MPDTGKPTNRKVAEEFGEFMFRAILLSVGDRSTAHKCVAEWWVAIERGEFGDA